MSSVSVGKTGQGGKTYGPHSLSADWRSEYVVASKVRALERVRLSVPRTHDVHNSFWGYPRTP